ncbi:MAG TPA: phosphate ABC transporter permease subunit PstC [Mycobacteriales bacterium]|jgi:phosphate transport system permease protein|nr:phosphate ABC transporter permease subunit PstC [Mycobacteriales bacterium]
MTATTISGRRQGPATDLRRRRRPGETVIELLLALCGILSVGTTVAIVGMLVRDGGAFFGEIGVLDFLFGTTWQPKGSPAKYGVLALLSGTLLVATIALLVAVPLGLSAAIYLSEYARPRARRILKPMLEVLAGVPTVVYGFFALTWVTPQLKKIFPDIGVFNALAAGLVMGIMIIPTIASVSEDAMRAVPQSLREGAFGLGAGKRRVAVRVVVPAALSGIAAGIILGVSRAVGETMIVAVAAGATPNLTADPLKSVQTMTGYIASVAGGEGARGTTDYSSIFAVGLTLFVLTLILNLISVALVRRFRQVYQ